MARSNTKYLSRESFVMDGEPNSKPADQKQLQTNSSVRFSIRSLIAITVTIVALVGWFSAQRNYELAAKRLQNHQKFLDAASIQAAPLFKFEGMVGRSIDDFPLIQLLGNPTEVQSVLVLDQWDRRKAFRTDSSISDRFENKPEHWGKIDSKRTVTLLTLVLEHGVKEGQNNHYVTIVVQDSIIRLIWEDRFSAVH